MGDRDDTRRAPRLLSTLRLLGLAGPAIFLFFWAASPARSSPCEAVAGARCYYVDPVSGLDLNPGTIDQPFFKPHTAITRAQGGDVIYLRGGSYTQNHAHPFGVSNWNSPSTIHYAFFNITDAVFPSWAGTANYTVKSGSADNPITLKAYPGERPLLDATGMAKAVMIAKKNYWVIDGFEMQGAGVQIWGGDSSDNTHDITIQNNDIHHVTGCCGDNAGIIKIDRGDWGGAYNIFILNNRLHDLVEQGYTWETTADAQHFGAITTLSCEDYLSPDCGGTGNIVIRGNTMYNLPQTFFFKNPGNGPVLIEYNIIYNAQTLGSWVTSNVTFQRNVVYDMGRRGGISIGGGNLADPAVFPLSGRNEVIRYNTFVGLDSLVRFRVYASNHVIKNNIVFGLNTRAAGAGWDTGAYVSRGSWESAGAPGSHNDSLALSESEFNFGNDFDNNCLISPNADFQALSRYIPLPGGGWHLDHLDLVQMQSAFGLERNSLLLIESDPATIFVDPAARDYRLPPGSACAEMGAYAGQQPPVADTVAPTVSITAPANDSTVSGTAVTVSANVSDNVGVAGVQFKLDGNHLGAEDTSDPYSVPWNTTLAANGSHTLTATARDAAGNSATAAVVTVTVNNAVAPSTVANGSTLNVQPGANRFNLTDPGTYRLVGSVIAPSTGANSFWIDMDQDPTNDETRTWDLAITSAYQNQGVSWRGANSATCFEPGCAQYNPKTFSLAAGVHTLHIITREAGSLIQSVRFVKVPPDTVAPAVSITAPSNGATVSGTAVTVSASASDNVGVSRVEFYVDGVLKNTDTAGPYSSSWDTTNGGTHPCKGAHTHTLVAKAFDAAGSSGTSASVIVNMNDPSYCTVTPPSPPTPTPPSSGNLSSRYPGDIGIENDPNVLFSEKFDEGSVAQLTSRYDDVLNAGGLSFVSDVPQGSGATQSLLMTAIGGQTNGAHLYKNLANIGKAAGDTMYLRYYIKYRSGITYHHNGVWFGGYNPPLNWPNPRAGTKPVGNDRFSVASEPVQASGRFDNYVYWKDMHSDPFGSYWGNDFLQDSNVKVTPDQWMCVETMVKLNNPASSPNGELAFWINGQKKNHLGPGFPNGSWTWDSFYPSPTGAPFPGFQWRTDPALNLNWLWLEHYSDTTPVGQQSQIQLANIVAAKTPVGCLSSAAAPPPPLPSGSTVTFTPTADTFINLDATAYSADAKLNLYTWPSNQVANAVLMKFNLSSIPAGATITNAALTLSLTDADPSSDSTYTVSAHKIINKNPDLAKATGYTHDGINSWTPSACCYNSIPLAQGDIAPAIDSRAIDKTPGFKQWNVTAIVQDWITNPAANYGLLLNSDPTKFQDRYRYFASTDHPTVSSWPSLSVMYTRASTPPPPPPSDMTSPSVSITAPAAGSAVAGTVTVSASATDNLSVVGVQFKLDGVNLGAEKTSSPYFLSWNTALVSNGSHTLSALARDAAGNTATSASVSITVSNSAPPSPPPVPSGGISASYPGDVNIESHPDVLFVERFDDTVASVHSRWTDVKGGSNMTLTSDRPAASSGGTSLRIQGGPSGGHLYKNLAAIGRASNDAMYVRYYVKYPGGSMAQHNGVWIGGYNPPLNWPNPQAGVRPLGSDRFSAAVEDNTGTHVFDIYHYWMGMRPDARGTHWGNVLLNNPNVTTKLDQWMCVEQMVKLNNPATSLNGEHAMWLDGTKVSHLGQGFPNGHWVNGRFYQNPADSTVFEGFQWRNTSALNLNYVWLQNYTATTLTELEFDHLVVAKSHIGCLASRPPPSDSTPPTVSMTAPANGATVSGTMTVSATASDNMGVVGVQFRLDGANLGTEDTSAPFSLSWNTTLASNGSHTLTAVARDAAGNAATASAVTVTVSNSSSTVSLFPQDTFINVNRDKNSAATTLNLYTWPDNKVANAILMKFDLSAISAGSIIQSATLTLSLTQADAFAEPTYTVTAHKIVNKNPNLAQADGFTFDGTNAWTPNTCCYSNIPLAQSDISAPFVSQAIGKALGVKSFNIAQMVQEWLNTPHSNFGLLLNSDASKLKDRFRTFASTEDPDPAKRPSLTILYSAPVADTTSPSVSIAAPANGATVSGSAVTISATASDNVGVAGVQFTLDGANLGVEDISSPFSISWNTTGASNGPHTLPGTLGPSALRPLVSGGRAPSFFMLIPTTPEPHQRRPQDLL